MGIRKQQRAEMAKLLELADRKFSEVTTGDSSRADGYSARDCLMAGLAIFGFKMPSMLEFDESCGPGQPLEGNVKRLYGLSRVPSDTTLRRRLDNIDPTCVHELLSRAYKWMRDEGALTPYGVFDGRIAIALDGTGYHTSTKVRCDSCLQVKSRDGTMRHEHSALAAAVVHPDQPVSLAFGVEPIVRADGATKNDCEQNAAKRLIERLKREDFGTRFVVLADALYATAPMLDALRDADMRFIVAIKSPAHTYALAHLEGQKAVTGPASDGKAAYLYRWTENVPLNAANGDRCLVNVVEQTEYIDDQERVKTWVTNLDVKTMTQAHAIARMGRCRWRIENDVFKTLKDEDGYHFGHNYGHGDRHLSTVMMLLMFVAFLFDSFVALRCRLFAEARARVRRLTRLWAAQRVLLEYVPMKSWDAMYEALALKRTPAM